MQMESTFRGRGCDDGAARVLPDISSLARSSRGVAYCLASINTCVYGKLISAAQT